MQAGRILSEIDREISLLQRARNLLAGDKPKRRAAASPVTGRKNGRRSLSAAQRRVISEKLRARWAERRKRAAKS